MPNLIAQMESARASSMAHLGNAGLCPAHRNDVISRAIASMMTGSFLPSEEPSKGMRSNITG